MIITSNVLRMTTDIDGEELLMELKFDIDLQVSEDYPYNKKLLYVKFNKDGKVIDFPSLGDDTHYNPRKYIAKGKAVERILALEESNYIKELYNKSLEIYEAYWEEKEKTDEGNVYKDRRRDKELYKNMLKTLSLLEVIV